MDFGGRSRSGEPVDAAPKHHPQRHEEQQRPQGSKTAVRGGWSASYKERDAELFDAIQAAFTDVPAERSEKPGRVARPEPVSRPRDYSQRDQEAFEKLMKFRP